jgi:hypothetical protein
MRLQKKNIDVHNNLDIYEMIIICNELMKKLANKELLFFRHYHVNNKKIKCPLEWGEKHEPLFSKLGSLLCKFLAF